MKYFFSLRIDANPNQVTQINNILGIEPNYSEIIWGYNLIVQENKFTNFIDIFLDILENKYDKLQNIGIQRENISIWMIYEFKGQCNMEFTHKEMKRLGINEIDLCISCYEL